ncbi:DUF4349 domain-containing protein [Sphingosinicella terrae]|jgi:hypothetical protein|uniref:DUF4349 domain-containing protein n=1 Tax=Sphingosinicella terrae TaxID=2172047 RepID=UPI000E0DDF11|nr:DUF4349 domain-containing protein [Sphingosinicella terrae]
MTAGKFNPLALVLCIAAVLALGWAVVTMTASREAPHFEAPPLRAMNAPADPPSLEMMPSVSTPRLPPPRTGGQRAGPDVALASAPGVAFSYLYAFQLPGERIAGIQEQHARACERLGASRCRITAMQYRAADPATVEAMLSLKVEPSLARRFGQLGSEAVERAAGTLVDVEISGLDVDASIRSAARRVVELQEELRRIEGRLGSRLSPEERVRLDAEALQLRQSIRAVQDSRIDQRDSLASTPMAFHYRSTPAVAEARETPSLAASADRAIANFMSGVTILLIVVVTLLPWAIAAATGWGIFRLFRPRPKAVAPDPVEVAATG